MWHRSIDTVHVSANEQLATCLPVIGFGKVIRITAGTYRVEVNGVANTFWPIEVEKR